eukprot:gene6178-8509_t
MSSENFKETLKQHLSVSIQQCSTRGLFNAAYWTGELLLGMREVYNNATSSFEKEGAESLLSLIQPIDAMSINESHSILFANSLLHRGEYQRCAHFLRKENNNNYKIRSNTGLFILYYAQYMAGEKLKDQLLNESQREIVVDTTSKPTSAANKATANQAKKALNGETIYNTKNSFLNDLFRDLTALYNNKSMDGFLLYLYGVVVRDLHKNDGVPFDSLLKQVSKGLRDENKIMSADRDIQVARRIFMESLIAYPWNWSCWRDLSDLCISEKLPIPQWSEFTSLLSGSSVQNHLPGIPSDESLFLQFGKIMYTNFVIHIYLEKHQGERAMPVIESALQLFPTSHLLYTQVGLAHYSLRDYDKAQEYFELIRDSDPYRLAHIDIYSNILYVKEKRAELSHLAHVVVKIDKFSPESCCVVGNYYSLKGQHEKAVTYFQRALKLDKNYLSAWTLMGHEFMELRNTAAAVQSYRMAVDISETDYRAWYGLGQTYEMLHLYQYASYYYRKACALRPNDARMWCAVGNCIRKLGIKSDAIAIFERAVACGDREGIATRDLARLYRDDGQSVRAVEFYFKFLQVRELLDSEVDIKSILQYNNSSSSLTAITPEMLGLLDKNGNVMSSSSNNGVTVSLDSEQAEATIYIANYFKSCKVLRVAEMFCNRLLSFVGPEGDEARAIMRDIRSTYMASGGIGNVFNMRSNSNNREDGVSFELVGSPTTPAIATDSYINDLLSESNVNVSRFTTNNNNMNNSRTSLFDTSLSPAGTTVLMTPSNNDYLSRNNNQTDLSLNNSLSFSLYNGYSELSLGGSGRAEGGNNNNGSNVSSVSEVSGVGTDAVHGDHSNRRRSQHSNNRRRRSDLYSTSISMVMSEDDEEHEPNDDSLMEDQRAASDTATSAVRSPSPQNQSRRRPI